jgi:hypothetical protein
MRTHFPHPVELSKASAAFSHMLSVFSDLGVTSINDLWIHAHLWVEDHRLQVKDRNRLTQLDIWEARPGFWVATPHGDFHLRPPGKPYSSLGALFDHDD